MRLKSTYRPSGYSISDQEFIDKAYEIAFGADAMLRRKHYFYGHEAVLEKLKEFSDNALKWEERT